jgi:hypothetical protein
LALGAVRSRPVCWPKKTWKTEKKAAEAEAEVVESQRNGHVVEEEREGKNLEKNKINELDKIFSIVGNI